MLIIQRANHAGSYLSRPSSIIVLAVGARGNGEGSDRPEGQGPGFLCAGAESVLMMADARAKRFEAVLVYRVDRLARSQLILLGVCEELKHHDVSLRSMTEAFDAGTPSGQLLLQLLSSFAEHERASILERTRLGKARRIRSGRRAGGTPLLGYKTAADGHMEIESAEADIVRDIFRLYVEGGMSTAKLADYLNAKNVPTSAEIKGTHRGHLGKWRPSRICAVLRNPAYKGEFHCQVSTGDGSKETILQIPPIVDESTWEQARATVMRNKTTSSRNSNRTYLLRGLIRCGACGELYTGCVLNGTFMYYRCRGNTNYVHTLGERCRSPMVRGEQLEEMVWSDIKSFVQNPGSVI